MATKKPKVKVPDVSEKDLAETNALRVRQANTAFKARPFVTKTYMSLHYGFPMEWLNKHWNEIIKH